MNLRINPKIIVEAIGVDDNDDYVVYVEKETNAFVINSVAYDIIQLIVNKDEVTFESLIINLTKIYNIDGSKIEEDVKEIINLFLERNIILINQG